MIKEKSMTESIRKNQDYGESEIVSEFAKWFKHYAKTSSAIAFMTLDVIIRFDASHADLNEMEEVIIHSGYLRDEFMTGYEVQRDARARIIIEMVYAQIGLFTNGEIKPIEVSKYAG
jgi:hypothetical protein